MKALEIVARFEGLPYEGMEHRKHRGVPLTMPPDVARSSHSSVAQVYRPPTPNTKGLICRHFLFITYLPLLERKLYLEQGLCHLGYLLCSVPSTE